IGDNAMIWKERYIGRTWGGWLFNSTAWIYLYMIFGILIVLGVIIAASNLESDLAEYGLILRIAWIILAALIALSIGVRLAASVSREREHQTLVSLLASTYSPQVILEAKWIGTLARSRRAFIGLAMLFLAAGLSGGIPSLSWVLLPLVYATQV